MIITADNFFSLQVAAWLATAGMVVALAWRMARRVQPMWLRVFVRAAVVTLCFAPLPNILMFTEEGAKAGILIITPLWYALFSVLAKGTVVGTVIVLFLWLVATYFFWVVGMSVHHLFRKHPAA